MKDMTMIETQDRYRATEGYDSGAAFEDIEVATDIADMLKEYQDSGDFEGENLCDCLL